jgi:hypothetical protein
MALFDVVVSVGNLLSSYLGGHWQYLAPSISSVSPTRLAPHPDGSQLLTITGQNLGSLVGNVVVGARHANCSAWTNSVVTCLAPHGVVASAEVVLVAASGQSSGANLPLGRMFVSYFAPEVHTIRVPRVPTRGGVVLEVWGIAFAVPLPVSVWLVPPSASPGVAPWALPASIPCPLVASSSLTPEAVALNDSHLSCVVGEGMGPAWSVVVVNHEVRIAKLDAKMTCVPEVPTILGPVFRK